MISIIVAMSPNHAIGYKGRLPWHLPEDLARFKSLTMGHAIIMGRKTFESLPHGALPGRRNVVVSRNFRNNGSHTGADSQTESFQGCDTYGSLREAMESCKSEDETFVIGGASVYRQVLPLADRLYVTLVDDNPPQADTFFPHWNKDEWTETKKEKHTGFSFIVFDRAANS